MSCIATKDMLKGKLALALCGVHDSGKTGTLLRLIDRCREGGYKELTSIPPTKGGTNDRIVVLEDAQDASFRVGISTGGDAPKAIAKGFAVFNEFDCKLVILPTRSTGRTWDEFKNQCESARYDYKWCWKKRCPCKTFDEVNNQIADALFMWLQK